jgi:hypothetical protein
MNNELEFPYRLKTWFAFGLPAVLIVLLAIPWLLGASPPELLDDVFSVRFGFFVLLIPFMVIALPLIWFWGRGQVLRLTDSELRVGKVVLPLHELNIVKIVKQAGSRSMIVQTGKRKAVINEMCLPSPQAFDQVYQALTSDRR